MPQPRPPRPGKRLWAVIRLRATAAGRAIGGRAAAAGRPIWRACSWVFTRRGPLEALIVLSLVWLAYGLLCTDVETTLRFRSLTLTEVADFGGHSAEDFNLSGAAAARLGQVDVEGQMVWNNAAGPLDGLSLAVPDPPARPCTSVRLTTSALQPDRAQPATGVLVGLVPAGAADCRTMLQLERRSRAGVQQQEIRSEQLITLHLPGTAEGATSLLQRVQATQIGGRLSLGADARDGELTCGGERVDQLGGAGVLLRTVAVVGGAAPAMEARLDIVRLLRLRVDGRDCRWPLAKKVLLGWLIADGPSLLVPAVLTALFAWVRRRIKRGPPKPKPKPRRAKGATPLVLPIVLSVATCATAEVAAAAEPPARDVLIVSAWTDCKTWAQDDELKDRLSGEDQRLAGAIRAAARDVRVTVVPANPSAAELHAALARVRGPLWFIYAGHAHMAGGRSRLCLRQGPLSIERLVAAPSTAATAASFWVAACSSAAAEVARPGTSLFSLSSLDVDTGLTSTLGITALKQVVGDPTDLAQPVDVNCDGLVTDEELFDATVEVLPKHARGRKPPRPKLRRQAWSPLPLFEARGLRSTCRAAVDLAQIAARHPGLGPVLELERRHRAGRAMLDVEQAPPVVWTLPAAIERAGGNRETSGLRLAADREEAAALARALLVPRFWWVDRREGRVVVTDLARDTSPLWQGVPATAGDGLEALRPRLLWTPVQEEGQPPGIVRRRYSRPVRADERRELARLGFVPCACLAKKGACYCANAGAAGAAEPSGE